jgi:hypothetical protein
LIGITETAAADNEGHFAVGDPVPATYHYQDVDSNATVTFYLDADANPYNGNESQTDEQVVVQTGSVPSAQSAMLHTDGVSAGTYYVLVKISDGGHTRYAYAHDPITLGGGPSPVDDYALSETVVHGTVTGDYVDTQTSDDIYQTIQERQSGGKRSSRHSYLEHKWTFDVTGGTTVTVLT